MRYLVTVELIDGTFIHLISEFSQKNLFVVKGRAKFSFQFYNKYTLSASPSPFNLLCRCPNLYRKLHNRNQRNSMIKGRIKSPCVSLECIKTSVTVFHRTNLQAGKQHILVTCYRNLYRNRFSAIDVVRGKFNICGSPFHFSHSFLGH